MGAAEDIYSWTVDAFYDMGDFFVDAGEWMIEPDNWEALGTTLMASGSAAWNGDWQQSWDIFTNPDLYYGDTWDDIEKYNEMLK